MEHGSCWESTRRCTRQSGRGEVTALQALSQAPHTLPITRLCLHAWEGVCPITAAGSAARETAATP